MEITRRGEPQYVQWYVKPRDKRVASFWASVFLEDFGAALTKKVGAGGDFLQSLSSAGFSYKVTSLP